MSHRLKIKALFPEGYKAVLQLDSVLAGSGIDPWYHELIKIRASQLNGCAYCLDMHIQDALKMGIEQRKINLIPTWKEATFQFTYREQVILKMTDAISFIHRDGLPDPVYREAISELGESMTAKIIMSIVLINAWNRIGVATKLDPVF